ncbi:hypothetical protein [Roseibium sp.]|uniref:hypothetical protein n=1 Tax=Roseibium sp. TaxID=1936156 RepID=UPI003D0CF3D0
MEMLSTFDTDDDEPLPQERSMAWLRRRRQIAYKRLKKALGRIDDTEDFLRMLWCTDRIGDKQFEALNFFTIQPKETVEFIQQPYRINKWTLETLVNFFLRSKPLRKRGEKRNKTLNVRHLNSPLHLIKLTNELENADDGLALKRVDVTGEIARLAQRQFPWQRGKMNREAFFKSAYLFTFPEADDYFTKKYGISVHDFCFAGFAIYAMLKKQPACQATPSVEDFRISAELLAKGMAMYAKPEQDLRKLAGSLIQVTSHSAYQSSVLRTWPCILIPNKNIMLSPIPDLVIERFTNGLYYDFVGPDGRIRDLIGKRFESYTTLMLESFVQNLSVKPEFKYGKKNQPSPDIFLLDQGETAVIIECKAKKATIAAKFGEEPDVLKDAALDELAKGAFQVWRFCSHVRRGIVAPPGDKFAAGISGLVVSMDTWMETSKKQHEEVLRRAKKRCADEDPEIIVEDQIPVAYCNIDDLSWVLRSCSDSDLLKTIAEAAKPDRVGWLLANIYNEIASDENVDKGDPLRKYIADIVKWWPEDGVQHL